MDTEVLTMNLFILQNPCIFSDILLLHTNIDLSVKRVKHVKTLTVIKVPYSNSALNNLEMSHSLQMSNYEN